MESEQDKRAVLNSSKEKGRLKLSVLFEVNFGGFSSLCCLLFRKESGLLEEEELFLFLWWRLEA